MTSRQVRLKALLQQRHWHNHGSFCREYRKAANTIDASLAKTPPSRQQLHRWMAGDIKGLPHPDHCQVLEAMFPEWTAAQLFQPYEPTKPAAQAQPGADSGLGAVLDAINIGLQEPDDDAIGWDSLTGQGGASDGTAATEVSETARKLGSDLVALASDRQLSAHETGRIAALAGRIVDLHLTITLDIASTGEVVVTYNHELVNLSSRPITRINRELWFQYTDGTLTIKPEPSDRDVGVQHQHVTPTMAKFACQISPPLQPGESVTVGYRGVGGRFDDYHYWREAIRRHTREFTLTVRDRRIGRVASCTATEEHADGLEHSAADSLVWTTDDGHALITLTRDHLCPNQAVELRWDV